MHSRSLVLAIFSGITFKNLYADIRTKKNFLIFTACLFFLSAALSVIQFPELKTTILGAFDGMRAMALDFRSSSLPSIIATIFVHNAIAAFIGLFSGLLLFIIPILFIIANGYLVGFVIIPRLSDIFRLLPHGIFELPALALACSYGIWLGMWPFHQGRIEVVKQRLKQCAAIYLFAVIPLLLVAAVIEGSLINSLSH